MTLKAYKYGKLVVISGFIQGNFDSGTSNIISIDEGYRPLFNIDLTVNSAMADIDKANTYAVVALSTGYISRWSSNISGISFGGVYLLP